MTKNEMYQQEVNRVKELNKTEVNACENVVNAIQDKSFDFKDYTVRMKLYDICKDFIKSIDMAEDSILESGHTMSIIKQIDSID